MINYDDIAEFKGQVIDIYEDFCERNHITISNPEKDEYDRDAGFEPGENECIIFGDDYDAIGDIVERYLNDNDGLISKEVLENLVTEMNKKFLNILIERGELNSIGLDMNTLIKAWDREEEFER